MKNAKCYVKGYWGEREQFLLRLTSRLGFDCLVIVLGFLPRGLGQWATLRLVCRKFYSQTRNPRWLSLLTPVCNRHVNLFALSRLEGLKVLDLGTYGNQLQNFELQSLSLSLTSLQSLYIRECSKLTSEGFVPFTAFSALQTLQLIGCNDTAGLVNLPASLRSLDISWSLSKSPQLWVPSFLTSLQDLNLSFCCGIESLGFLTPLTTLTTLTLRGCCEVADDMLVVLSALVQLQTLDLSTCVLLTNACLPTLVPSLRNLNLSRVNITNKGVLELTHLTELQMVNVKSTCVTREGALALSRAMPSLSIRL